MAELLEGTTKKDSKRLSKVKASGSKIEMTLRKELWHRGLHYRKNVNTVYGKPDICFKGIKLAVFCDSEFWHGYDWDSLKDHFQKHRDFWISKIERNIQRDKEVNAILQEKGWLVLRFWGNDILKNTTEIADTIEDVYKRRKQELR